MKRLLVEFYGAFFRDPLFLFVFPHFAAPRTPFCYCLRENNSKLHREMEPKARPWRCALKNGPASADHSGLDRRIDALTIATDYLPLLFFYWFRRNSIESLALLFYSPMNLPLPGALFLTSALDWRVNLIDVYALGMVNSLPSWWRVVTIV